MVQQPPVMANQKQIIESIADCLTLPAADIDPDMTLKDDLGMNPVEVADLLHNLAANFDIIFDPEETTQLRTVSDLIVLIEDKLLE